MRDLNFFEPYLFREQKAEEKRPLYTLLKALAILLIVAIPAGILGGVLYNQADIAKMQAELSSPAMQETLKRIDDKQKKLLRLQTIQPVLQQADAALKFTDYVDDKQLQAIAAAVPQNLVIGNTVIGIEGCEISGTALKKAAIAELEYNLRHSGLFDSIFLDEMALMESNYEFKITFSLKGVQLDEADKKRK